VTYKTHEKADLAAATLPRITGTLRSMKSGELKSVTMDDGSSRVLFLRSYATGKEEVNVSHILVAYKGAAQANFSVLRTKEEALLRARELRKKITEGANFEQIAKAASDGESAASGGRIDPVARGTMLPAFEQAAFSQKPGTISEPIETQFGYHIIRTDSAPRTLSDQAAYEELIIASDSNGARANAILEDLRSGNVRSVEDAPSIP
jgi:parvulin-like peptidyl-prolyl isomerase